MLAGVVAVAGGAGVFLLRDDSGSGVKDAAAPNAASDLAASPPVATQPVPKAAPDPRRAYPEKQAFEVAGVRFTVVGQPDQPWVSAVRAIDPGAGRRWAMVSVIYRNLARQRLFAPDLNFRLRAADGSIYDPAPNVGNGGSNLTPETQIFPGTLVHGHLAFAVAADEGALTLLIDPSPNRRIRVELADD